MNSGVFINLTNHPLREWKTDQISAAYLLLGDIKYQRIEDFTFPNINPYWSKKEIFEEVCNTVKKLENLYKEEDLVIIHIMGEMTFVHQFVSFVSFTKPRWRLVASTTEKIPYTNDTGKKRFRFNFCRFRSY
jgi:hypothetical protein